MQALRVELRHDYDCGVGNVQLVDGDLRRHLAMEQRPSDAEPGDPIVGQKLEAAFERGLKCLLSTYRSQRVRLIRV